MGWRDTRELVAQFLFRDRGQDGALVALDGAVRPNDLLDELAVLGDPVLEPEDVVVSSTGDVYTATGSQLMRLAAGDPGFVPVTRLPGPITALALDSGDRVVAGVAGVGLVVVDAGGGHTVVLTEAGGAPMNCITAIDAARDGEWFVTDGSADFPARDWVWDLMSHGASGRLVRVDPGSGAATVLAERLRYPSGVCGGEPGTVVVSEAWAHAVTGYSTTDGRRGRALLANFPAYPGRIRRGADGYWLASFARRTHIVEFVLTQVEFRERMMREIAPEYWIRPALRTLDHGFEPLQQGQIRKLGTVKPWAPPRSYGLLVRLDADGEPVRSWHSRAGATRHGVVGAAQYGSEVYVAVKGGDVVLAGRVGA